MGVFRDLSDVLRAAGLAAGAGLLPVGLVLALELAAPSDGPPNGAERAIVGVAEAAVATPPVRPDPTEPTIAETQPASGPEPTSAPELPPDPVDAPPAPATASRIRLPGMPVVTPTVVRRDTPLARSAQEGTAEAPPAPAPTAKRRQCQPSGMGGITRVGTSAWVVERDVVAYYASHLGALGELGWVERAEDDDGRSIGFQLHGIRCGSDLHLAGLRTGDVVRSVNGQRMRSLAAAFLTYTRLKKADVIEVEVLRRTGVVETLTYTLS